MQGSLTVPGDKSISHRSLMLGGIAMGQTRIRGFLASEDCLATLSALAALGVRIERPQPTDVIMHGVGAEGLHGASKPLDMGNAGTAMRLSMGLLAGRPFASTLVGDASLMRRPMERVAAPLRQRGPKSRPRRVGRRCGCTGVGCCMPSSMQCRWQAPRSNPPSCWPHCARTAPPGSRSLHPTRDHTERMLRAFGVGWA